MVARFRFHVGSLAFTLVLLVAVMPTVSVGATAPAVFSPDEQTLASALLTQRGNEGLQPLTIDPTLTLLAEQRCAEIASEHSFGHVTTDGKTVFDLLDAYGITYHKLGETLAMNANTSDPGAEAARDLMNSPLHHATLFDPQYTAIGFGHSVGADGIQYFAVIVLS